MFGFVRKLLGCCLILTVSRRFVVVNVQDKAKGLQGGTDIVSDSLEAAFGIEMAVLVRLHDG